MTTVYSDPLFIKTRLTTADGQVIYCTLRDSQNRFVADLLRSESRGAAVGRMVEPPIIPDWLVPGTVLYGTVQSIKAVFTYDGVIQSRITGVSEMLGDKLRFSYTAVVEFQ